MYGQRFFAGITWMLVAATAIGAGNLTSFGLTPPASPVRIAFDDLRVADVAPGEPYLADPGSPPVRVPIADPKVVDPIPTEPAPEPVIGPATPRSPLYAYRCRLTPEGFFEGMLEAVDPTTGVPRPARHATVRFFQQGESVGEVPVGVDGRFSVDGLTLGACAIIAAGPDGFLAFAVDVLPPKPNPDPYAAVLDASTPLHALLMPPRDAILMDHIIIEYLASTRDFDGEMGEFIPPHVAFGQGNGAGRGPAGVGGPPPGRLLSQLPFAGGRGAVRPGFAGNPPVASVAQPTAQPAPQRAGIQVPPVEPIPLPDEFLFPDGPVLRAVPPVVKRQSLQVDDEGISIGRIVTIDHLHEVDLPAVHERIYFVADGQIVGETTVNRHGLFRVRGLLPRQYSIITIGRDGFAAFGIEVFQAKNDAARNDQPHGKPAQKKQAQNREKRREEARGAADRRDAAERAFRTQTFDASFVAFLQASDPNDAAPANPPNGTGRDNAVNFEYALIDLRLLLQFLQLPEGGGGGGMWGGGFSSGGGGGGAGGGFDPLALLGLLGLLGLLDDGPDDPPVVVSPFRP